MTSKNSKLIKNPYECADTPTASKELVSPGKVQNSEPLPIMINVNPEFAKKVKRLSIRVDFEFKDQNQDQGNDAKKPVENRAKIEISEKLEKLNSNNETTKSSGQVQRIPSEQLSPRKFDSGRKRREYFLAGDIKEFMEALKIGSRNDSTTTSSTTNQPKLKSKSKSKEVLTE